MATTSPPQPDHDLAGDMHLPGGAMHRFEYARTQPHTEGEATATQEWRSSHEADGCPRQLRSASVVWFSSALQQDGDPVRDGWYLMFHTSATQAARKAAPAIRIGPMKCNAKRFIEILIQSGRNNRATSRRSAPRARSVRGGLPLRCSSRAG